MNTTAIKKIAEPEVTASRSLPKIDPVNVHLDSAGHAYRSWFVRLPLGMIADDLKEPSIWARTQRKVDRSLRKFDRVTLVAYDESWLADGIVSAADQEGVTLTALRIAPITQRAKPLFQDDTYRIVWAGVGYVVERKSDAHRMTPIQPTEQLAIRELSLLHPQHVSGGLVR